MLANCLVGGEIRTREYVGGTVPWSRSSILPRRRRRERERDTGRIADGIPPRREQGSIEIHTTQQLEIIRERPGAVIREVLADGAAEEQDQDDGGGDPEGAVEIGVPLEHVEEVVAREQGGPAAREDGARVDVEELRVERQRPQVPLRRGGARRAAAPCRRGRREPRRRRRRVFPARRRGVGECRRVEF